MKKQLDSTIKTLSDLHLAQTRALENMQKAKRYLWIELKSDMTNEDLGLKYENICELISDTIMNIDRLRNSIANLGDVKL